MSNAQMVSVDITKLSAGMKTIFSGCALLFDSLGVPDEAIHQMNHLAENSGKQEPKEASKADTVQNASAAKDFSSDDDEPPFDMGEPNAVQIAIKDLQKVAAQKITSNRKNSGKIQQLLRSYGCVNMSDLPEDKREAFLNDLAQL